MRDLANRGRDVVVDDDQVVIRIERQMIGIERPLGLRRRERERFGEAAGTLQKAGIASPAAETAAVFEKRSTRTKRLEVHSWFKALVE